MMAEDSNGKVADMPTNKELAEQLSAARKDIETLAQMAGSRARNEAEHAAMRVSDQIDELSEETRAIYEAARRQGTAVRHNAEDQIRENPLLATGLAVAAGFILAQLLRR